MSLLQEIQSSLMQDAKIDMGQTLLKLRFLAAQLGSNLLEEWVKYELDGYPEDLPVPNYRKLGVAYKGTFTGSFGSGFKNAPIPPVLIKKYAKGPRNWIVYEMRQSIAQIDSLVQASNDAGDTLNFDASNLIILLQGKVYKGMACNSITGVLSKAEIEGLHFAVRKRGLDLTINLEKEVPISKEIVIGKTIAVSEETAASATLAAHRSIYAENFTVIVNSGEGDQSVSVSNVRKGDIAAFEKALVEGGIDKDDASKLAKILPEEEPQSRADPFGKKASAWISKKLEKSAEGSWQLGKEIAKELLIKAATGYYFN